MLNRSNGTRIVKLEQARSARARRYCFYYDEVAKAEAQGLPYALLPRVLSRREWIERYGQQPIAEASPDLEEAKSRTPHVGRTRCSEMSPTDAACRPSPSS